MKALSSKEYFDTQAKEWNEHYKINKLFIERLDVVKSLIDHNQISGKKVLDLGCGSGIISSFFSTLGAEVQAIDISDSMIEQAKLIYGNISSIHFQTGDAAQLPFPDNHFDIISCISVLEWAEDDKKVLFELARVLKRSGVAIISVPNQASISRYFERFVSKSKKAMGLNPGYLLHQKRQYLPRIFEKDCQLLGMKKHSDKYYVMPFSQFRFFRTLSSSSFFGMIYFIKLEKI